MAWLEPMRQAIGAIGVAVIVLGVLAGAWRFIRAEFVAVRGVDATSQRWQLRHALGYHLLLGLEFLIAADIIETLIKPTAQDLIILGAIVAIRTVISFSLNAELKREERTALPAGRRAPARHEAA